MLVSFCVNHVARIENKGELHSSEMFRGEAAIMIHHNSLSHPISLAFSRNHV